MQSNNEKMGFMANDKIRWGLTLFLGMLVVLWRVVLPTNTDITVGIVILAVTLDLILTASVIYLNKKELKAAFAKRFTLKDVGKTALLIVADFIIITVLVIFVSIDGVSLADMMANAPAALVAVSFREVFMPGAFISMVIFAPLWEEIVFRFAGKKLLENGLLFVVATSCLFAFIHTANFSLADNLYYLAAGAIYATAYLLLKDIRILIAAHFIWNLLSGIGSFIG
ncbi:MAG: CPBP family glutamic-type intramembrane protease [Lachnospiraceae bacterium]|nr:CPBP family glutamic-type intramembrane protease [Lachnospiraceae bacterium]